MVGHSLRLGTDETRRVEGWGSWQKKRKQRSASCWLSRIGFARAAPGEYYAPATCVSICQPAAGSESERSAKGMRKRPIA